MTLEDNVVMVGHSLGGGLAQIVGVRHNFTTFSFSGPGIKMSHRKFNIRDVESIDQLVVSIQPERDVVPMIDIQSLNVNHISCKKSTLDCHSMTRTICELVTQCGDIRGRGIVEGANGEYVFNDTNANCN